MANAPTQKGVIITSEVRIQIRVMVMVMVDTYSLQIRRISKEMEVLHSIH